jgi:glycosyltransferase involved in cell wall biosynthesis
MHISLISHNIKGGDGQGRVNAEITKRCIRKGHEVTLVADDVDPELLEMGARWIPVHPALQRPILLKVIDFAWRANRVIDQIRNQVDVICANGVVCSRPHDINVAHFVHTAWQASDLHDARTQSGLRGWYQRVFTAFNGLMERRVFAKSKILIAVSERIAAELNDLSTGVPVTTIPNGVDTWEFRPTVSTPEELTRRDEYRELQGLPLQTPVALFAGDLSSSRKNLDTVLKALQINHDWHLVVAGDLNRSSYPNMVRDMGLTDRIDFIGFCQDMPRLMRACDLFVFPSAYEPFALVVLEAMASGLPVVTASTVGAAPLVSNQAGHVLRDPFDAENLARSLSTYSDPDRRRRAGKAARTIAENNNWSKMADSYISTFAASI